MASKRDFWSDPGNTCLVGWICGTVTTVALAILHVPDPSSQANEVCESVSKGSVWDNESKKCVHINKEAVSEGL